MIDFNPNRIYLSGPMTGIPDDNRPAFRAATAALRAAGHEVISPDELDQTNPPSGHTWSEFLSRDIPFVVRCGIGVVLPGWRRSKGSVLEMTIMRSLGRPVLELETQRHLFTPGADVRLLEVSELDLPPLKVSR